MARFCLSATQNAAAPLASRAQLAAFPEIEVSFDPIRDRQHLTCTGVLSPERVTLIKLAAPSLTALVDGLVGQARSMFDRAFKDDLADTPAVTFDRLFTNRIDAAGVVDPVTPASATRS